MTQAKIRIMPGGHAGLTSTPVLTLAQATAGTFVNGAPVKVASGVLTAVSTTASLGASSALTCVKKSSTTTIVAISNGSATASLTTALTVTRIQEGQRFIGNLINGVASSAKMAATSLHSNVVLAKVTSGDTHWGWANDASSTIASYASYVKGKVVGLIDAASTINGRVLVEITVGGALHA